MGRYSVTAEEEAIRQVLAGSKTFDDVVANPDTLATSVDDWLAQYLDDDADDQPEPAVVGDHLLYAKPVDFLRDALHEYYPSPEDKPLPRDLGGVAWRPRRPGAAVDPDGVRIEAAFRIGDGRQGFGGHMRGAGCSWSCSSVSGAIQARSLSW